MRRGLSIALRVLVAAAGTAYIAWAMHLSDRLTCPAGFAFADGAAVEERVTLTVIGRGEDGFRVRWQGETRFVPQQRVGPGRDAANLEPGVRTLIQRAEGTGLVLGLLITGLVFPLVTVRWWMLLRARALVVSLRDTFRLTMVGAFFNFCLPGMTGGDLVRAYYVARDATRRADALMTVVVDRVGGFLGLFVLAAVAGLFMVGDPTGRTLAGLAWAGCALVAGGAGLYMSRWGRRWFGLEKLGALLTVPRAVRSLDQALRAYRRHPGVLAAAVGMGAANHLVITTGAAAAGYALGLEASFGLVLVAVPLLFAAAAIPLTYQGLGVMEAAGVAVLGGAASTTQIVGMLLLIRVYLLFYSLFGALELIFGDVRFRAAREMGERRSP